MTMKRIAVIGSGGSGKSTLARQLGETLQLPVYHLDKLYWQPNWQALPQDEWKNLQESLCNKSTWIMDGDYGGTVDIRLAAADTIIFLDIPRLLCLWRVTKRFLRYRGSSRPDMVDGNKERLNKEFLMWLWNYPKEKKPQILSKLGPLKREKKVIILSSPKAVKIFLAQLT
jgi:adenylate kinase family enzyme